jgi:hypothetical protein
LLHMADGPEANKNLDDLDKMEMEEDLVPARDALLDEVEGEGVEAEVVAVAVVAPRRGTGPPAGSGPSPATPC